MRLRVEYNNTRRVVHSQSQLINHSAQIRSDQIARNRESIFSLIVLVLQMTTDQMRAETLVVFSVVSALLLSPMASALPLHDSEIEASPSASELTARSSLNLPEWLAVARCRSVCVNEFARVRSDAACEADSNCSVCWSLCFRLTAQFALYRALCASVRRACKPGVVRACETACEHRLNQSAIAAVPQRVRTDVIVHASTANWNRSSRQFSLRFEGIVIV